ncbi:peptidoglycan DD-metalloendopeptidase family protein [Muricomes sp. OA1]|uniref:Peptidase M23 n=1 Tax=Hungatella hathewayi TaxID=154046 RepID=A0A3E2WJL0_9FIRM|nr:MULTISPECIES: M23 family metallopeptidase [Clostridia]MCH1972878.1 peptidoglycan DD-metalloendopeptidase family protein [Muricomes sp. OA1]RGC26683.1 peptidase M23 [Hungatella hathewayi]GKH31648.1 peptidase M23 [Faecalicatena contorta]
MRRRKRSIISTVLVIALSLGMVLNVNAATVDEAQKKAEELENQKKAAEKEKDSLASQLNSIIADMNDTKEKLEKKQDEIQKAEDELVQAKVDENDQYESMKKRIKFMYENGNSQLLEILVSSDSIGDLLNKAEYVSQISAYDRDMLIEFQDVVKDVEEKEASLKDEYEVLSGLQEELVAKQNEVQALLDSKKIQLADLEKQIGDNAATLQKLIEEAEAERIKQEQQQAAQQAAQQQQQSSGGGSYTPPSTTPVVSGSGQFTNPCPGAVISSTFGYRDFDGAFHKGLDLAAGEGTPTYAAADGTVVIAGWSDSAGNWVVINHGNGLTTKYMHHSALCVTAGQTVVKGQQIGYVGNTGNSFGAHLHFQVESGGVAVDPLGYL